MSKDRRGRHKGPRRDRPTGKSQSPKAHTHKARSPKTQSRTTESREAQSQSKGPRDSKFPESRSREAKSGTQPKALAPAAPRKPPGQRLWDMPYSAIAPRMINPALGLHNLVARAGHNAGYDIDLTLLDAPDHRLIRSGVLLAHRVLHGRGEWYLGAPDWVPLLPKERIDPMSHGDLPEELADLVRPFRRRAPLGPVAGLRCERREFALRDDRGTTMALLRDDKVTVRRGGLTTARYREVMMTPVGPGLTFEQDAWLGSCLGSAGATPVPKFPRLVTRLGAPSTGPTDFPEPQPVEAAGSFGHFVSNLLAARLRELLQADLGVRAEQAGAAGELASAATRLRAELEALGSVLDPRDLEDLDEELSWLVGVATGEQPIGVAGADLRHRLRGERYLTLLERLVTAARAPAGGDASALRAEDVLQMLLDAALQRLGKSAGRLDADSAPEQWESVRAGHDEVVQICALFGTVAGDRFSRLRGRLDGVADLLDAAAAATATAARTSAAVADATPAEAFELGRRYAAEEQAAHVAREEFVQHWAKVAKKLTA